MVNVWTDAAEAAMPDRHGERGSAFAYLSRVLPNYFHFALGHAEDATIFALYSPSA
jgi:hypothetical protein